MKKKTAIAAIGLCGLLLAASCVSGSETKLEVKKAVALPAGSTEASAFYPLTMNTVGSGKGGVFCADENMVGIFAKNYAEPGEPATWSPAPMTRLSQRLSIMGGTWPGESVFNPERYAEFVITPAAGKSFLIDSISLFAGGGGGGNMSYSIQYSTSADFSAPVELLSSTSNPKNTMTQKIISQPITIKAGEKLYLRIFPFYKDSASGKYLCISELLIRGVTY